jgi:hypothetical protein
VSSSALSPVSDESPVSSEVVKPLSVGPVSVCAVSVVVELVSCVVVGAAESSVPVGVVTPVSVPVSVDVGVPVPVPVVVAVVVAVVVPVAVPVPVVASAAESDVSTAESALSCAAVSTGVVAMPVSPVA